ncbi:MAG: hypothetical protein OXG35_25145 [Acidobacteria bacterium]|nr:hypothetical protein [Acidobacteriota bacterium]
MDKDAEGESAKLDTTLTNILVFGDDCRAATEWLRNESVSHDDEQGRRAGERRRHLKERGLLENGKRFVRICGQVVIDAGLVEVMAARQCIDWWQETWGESTLHFHKCENGVRWQPHGDSAEHKTLLCLSNPFTAPPLAAEADGRYVDQYEVSWIDDDAPVAERESCTTTAVEDADSHEIEDKPRWTLNERAGRTAEWLSEAAETVEQTADAQHRRASKRSAPGPSRPQTGVIGQSASPAPRTSGTPLHSPRSSVKPLASRLTAIPPSAMLSRGRRTKDLQGQPDERREGEQNPIQQRLARGPNTTSRPRSPLVEPRDGLLRGVGVYPEVA